ncbi:OpgC domain-containing protein [Belnapia rosea]|uniref:OpgC domain-containing protein n=1 Tax=Belnapia rosea TaxID=938405 RepID=UPI002109AF35|nr:OpgC domain-containing protein [Belnapia rosea]
MSAAWGLSDSSEQFLFLSGFALGSVLVLKEHRAGPRAAWRDLMLRVARLWRTHLIVVCGFAALVIATEMAFRWPGEAAAMGWSWLLVEPWLALPGAAILLYQPQYMGVLPVFILCMLTLPLLIRGMERVGAWALLPPLALYGAVQAWGWHLPGLGGTEVEFNPLAWQILFAIGAWFGRRALLRGRAIGRNPWLLAGAGLVLLLGLWLRLVEHGLIGGPALDLQALTGKQDLAAPRILHALSLAYVVVVLIPPRPMTLRAWPAQALAAAGRNSLNVFCLGLFFSYAAASLFRAFPGAVPWLDLPLVGGGALGLMAVAQTAERRRRDPALAR